MVFAADQAQNLRVVGFAGLTFEPPSKTQIHDPERDHGVASHHVRGLFTNSGEKVQTGCDEIRRNKPQAIDQANVSRTAGVPRFEPGRCSRGKGIVPHSALRKVVRPNLKPLDDQSRVWFLRAFFF